MAGCVCIDPETASKATSDEQHFCRREGLFALTRWRAQIQEIVPDAGQPVLGALERLEQLFAKVVEPMARDELRPENDALWTSAIQFLAQNPADPSAAFEALGGFLDRPVVNPGGPSADRAAALRALEDVFALLPAEPTTAWPAEGGEPTELSQQRAAQAVVPPDLQVISTDPAAAVQEPGCIEAQRSEAITEDGSPNKAGTDVPVAADSLDSAASAPSSAAPRVPEPAPRPVGGR